MHGVNVREFSELRTYPDSILKLATRREWAHNWVKRPRFRMRFPYYVFTLVLANRGKYFQNASNTEHAWGNWMWQLGLLSNLSWRGMRIVPDVNVSYLTSTYNVFQSRIDFLRFSLGFGRLSTDNFKDRVVTQLRSWLLVTTHGCKI